MKSTTLARRWRERERRYRENGESGTAGTIARADRMLARLAWGYSEMGRPARRRGGHAARPPGTRVMPKGVNQPAFTPAAFGFEFPSGSGTAGPLGTGLGSLPHAETLSKVSPAIRHRKRRAIGLPQG